jgi:uncharacterized membrane protein required for colicin V production
MTKMEDRVKTLLSTMNDKHQKKIDQQISGIFLFGFMTGIVFSYTGILGYIAGFLAGVVVRNSFSKKSQEFVEKSVDTFYNVFNKAKTVLNLAESP